MSIVNYLLKGHSFTLLQKVKTPHLVSQHKETILRPRSTKSHTQLANTLGLEFLPQPYYNISLTHLQNIFSAESQTLKIRRGEVPSSQTSTLTHPAPKTLGKATQLTGAVQPHQ